MKQKSEAGHDRAVVPELPDLDITQDGFLGGRVVVGQLRHGHRSGTDAVLLAATIPADNTATYLEFGAGAGVASLCLASRLGMAGQPEYRITGLDIRPELVTLARHNAGVNDMAAHVQFAEQDIAAPFGDWDAAPSSYDHVFANPPFYPAGTTAAPPDEGKRQAHIAPPDLPDIWIRRATTLVRSGGTVSLIYPAEGLADLLAAMQPRLGQLLILPIAPRPRHPARRVIIRGTRDSRASLKLLPPLIVHNEQGYQPAVEAVLREGAALPLE